MPAEPARTTDERGCPRVIGSTGRALRTCGHTIPCPYHGAPLHLVAPSTTTGGEGGE